MNKTKCLSILLLLLCISFTNNAFCEIYKLCTGNGDYCSPLGQGHCDANGMSCSTTDCADWSYPLSSVSCMQLPPWAPYDRCDCIVAPFAVLTNRCQEYCSFVSYNLYDCRNQKGTVGVAFSMNFCFGDWTCPCN
jgi:hypothetical protein